MNISTKDIVTAVDTVQDLMEFTIDGHQLRNESEVCRTCRYYHSQNMTCKLNPAITIPVCEGGSCSFWRSEHADR